MKTCRYTDEALAACPQPAATGAAGFCYYHAKIVDQTTLRAADALSETELDALFSGRPRNDGRRLDSYTRQKGVRW